VVKELGMGLSNIPLLSFGSVFGHEVLHVNKIYR